MRVSEVKKIRKSPNERRGFFPKINYRGLETAFRFVKNYKNENSVQKALAFQNKMHYNVIVRITRKYEALK